MEVLVIGAGVAGLSTAYHLARLGRTDVLVLEQEEKLGGHASGRNAGMIRQSMADPALVRLAHEGRVSLSRLGKRGWKNLEFRANGSLLLAKHDRVSELQKIGKTLRDEGLAFRWFSGNEAGRLVSVLKDADFEKGLFCPTDAVIDIRALLEGFLRELRRRGIPVIFGRALSQIERRNDGFMVYAGQRRFYAKKIVNAAGAWAGAVGRKAGATPIPFKAYRRHLFSSNSFGPMKASWPFVWDLSRRVYFRPQGKELLLSPCDKKAISDRYAAVRKEKVDPEMQDILVEKLCGLSKHFKAIKIGNAKSGLRTMTPDGRFVIGEDPKLRGFFWVAGLGGHGVTTCMSVGRLASELILGQRVDPSLKRAFSPKRFVKS